MSESKDRNGGEAKPKKGKSSPEDRTRFKRILEGLLFASRDPVTASRLASILGKTTAKEVEAILDELRSEYREADRAFAIEEVAGGYRLVTVPDLAPWVRQLFRVRMDDRLSPAALETLAIVAYRQPIIRADIDAIRGVQSGGTVKSLMERGLIKIVGRADVLGKPLLYGTTKVFLEQFGLANIADLPRMEEFRPVESTPDEDGSRDEISAGPRSPESP